MNNPDHPTFEPWENYPPEQLRSLLEGFRWIEQQTNPVWDKFKVLGAKAMPEVEAELDRQLSDLELSPQNQHE